jgi:Na+/phosphate symporter
LDAEYERELQKPVVQTKRPPSIAQERNSMISFLKGRGYKGLQRFRYPHVKELYDIVQESIKRELDSFVPMDYEKEKKLEEVMKEQTAKRKTKRKRTTHDDELSKKLKLLRTDIVDELRNYLRVVDFENPKKTEDVEKKSKISTFSVVESAEGDYLIFHRENESFRVFNMLLDILHMIDREDLYHLYLLLQAYFENTEPT